MHTVSAKCFRDHAHTRYSIFMEILGTHLTVNVFRDHTHNKYSLFTVDI